jgi:hypothetical protein
MWDDSTRYIVLGIMIFCLVLLFVLCFKKLRIRRDCWWKYGFEAPPPDMKEKIMQFREGKLSEDEAQKIKRLLFIYPCIRRLRK